MEARRYIEEVHSGQIILKNLLDFEGTKVEVILLPVEEKDALKIEDKTSNFKGILSGSGLDGLTFQHQAREEWE